MRKNQYQLYAQHEYVARANKADQTWWSKDLAIACLVVALSALDGVTLYTIFDKVLYNSVVISVILTAGCAITLNFIPLIIGRLVHLYRYRMQNIQPWMIMMMAATFLILFAACFALRWETRELSFSGSELSMLDSTGQNEGLEAVDSNGGEAVAITVLLGIMPAVTSLINLALGYFNDDPVKRKLEFMRTEREKAVEQREIMLAALRELDQDWATRLHELDEERREAAAGVIHDTVEQMRTLARLELAQALGDPTSINLLTEPELDPKLVAKSDVSEKEDDEDAQSEKEEIRYVYDEKKVRVDRNDRRNGAVTLRLPS